MSSQDFVSVFADGQLLVSVLTRAQNYCEYYYYRKFWAAIHMKSSFLLHQSFFKALAKFKIALETVLNPLAV